MKQVRLILLAITGIWYTSAALAQSCSDCRYISPVFDSVEVSSVQFGEGINADGNNQALWMDIYQPYGDTAAVRPVAIFAFGGGFIQDNRQEGYVIRACERFAKAGYVAVAIDYRIGIDPWGIFDLQGELMRVLFRPMQDMRGAIQYLNAHADSMGNSWRIDTSRIGIGGASAGAITALMVACCQTDVEFSEMGSLSSLDALGGFYSTSGFYANRPWDNIAGVYNIAGALINAQWVDPGDPPMVHAHGDQDRTVPIDGGNLDLGIAQLGLEGSRLVHQEAEAEGVCSYLYVMEGEDHPSGNASEEYFDQVFNRFMPRMYAVISGNSFCCDHSISVQPAVENLTEVETGDTVTLSLVQQGGTGPFTSQWCFVPCEARALGNQVTTVADSSFYAIATMKDASGCVSTDFTWVQASDPATSLLEEAAADMVVFPNPVRTELQVRANHDFRAVSYAISGIDGKMLRSGAIQTNNRIDTEGLTPGMYVLLLANSKGEIRKGRFVVQ